MRFRNPLRTTFLGNGFTCTLVVTLALIFGSLVYLNAATASMKDTYVAGIEVFKLLFNPGIFALLLLAFIAYTGNAGFASVVRYAMMGGMLICLIIYAAIQSDFHAGADHAGYREPGQRVLWTELYNSMRYPHFSNRSYGSVAGSLLIAIFTLFVTSMVSDIRSSKPH